MRIGIMGGTFNPIHYGHLVVAAEAGDQFKLDEIIFIPAGTPPHKDNPDIAPARARYEMVCLATRANPLFSVSSLEIERGGKSYSIETVEKLLATYGRETQLYFIIGLDAIKEIESWRNVDELLKLCEFIVAQRPGFKIEEIRADVMKRSRIMEIPEIGISATDVRRRIKEGKSIRYLVTLEVEEYIRRHNIYLLSVIAEKGQAMSEKERNKEERNNIVEKDAYKKLERRANYFSALLKVSSTISSEIDLNDVLQTIVRKTKEVTATDICSLRLLEGGWLVPKAAVGHSGEYLQCQRKLRVGESLAGLAVMEKRVVTADLTKDKLHTSPDLMQKEGMKSFLCAPLITKGKVIGALSVYTRKKLNYISQDAKDFISFLSEQCASALEHARLFEEAKEAYISSIAALSSAIDARDEYTAGHSQEVAEYACTVGKELGFSPERLRTLEFAALLHDIGKIGIPDYILLKPSSLTDSEWQIIKTHPRRGEEILKPLRFLKDVVTFVRQHQERYDGTGYPNGLKDKKISLEARILGVVDAYQAMTSRRPYRGAYAKEEAIKELRDKSGTQFDPVVVAAFLKVLGSKTEEKPRGKKPQEKKL